jgi:uncharacterized protein YjiS (DUF1127 family)
VIVHKRSLSNALAFVGSEIEFVAADPLLTRLGASVAAAWRVVLECERRRRSRQALRSLSRFEIQDFCLDLIEAEREGLQAVLARVIFDAVMALLGGALSMGAGVFAA